MPEQPQPQAARASLLPVADTSPGRARHEAARFLASCPDIPEDLRDVAVLLLSELVANAYAAMSKDTALRTRGIEFSLRLFADRLLVEVVDSSPMTPVPKFDEDPEAENWRGLAVVHRLSQEWGFFWHEGRKVVYFILPHTPEKETEECTTSTLP